MAKSTKMLIQRVAELESQMESLKPLITLLVERLPAFDKHIKAHDKLRDKLSEARRIKRAKGGK
jgi:hypothetical protein